MPIENTVGYESAKERREVERQCKALLKECGELNYDAEHQEKQWQNQIAQDLNTLMVRAMYFLETDRDAGDVFAARATLRIVKRVAEFEGIQQIK